MNLPKIRHSLLCKPSFKSCVHSRIASKHVKTRQGRHGDLLLSRPPLKLAAPEVVKRNNNFKKLMCDLNVIACIVLARSEAKQIASPTRRHDPPPPRSTNSSPQKANDGSTALRIMTIPFYINIASRFALARQYKHRKTILRSLCVISKRMFM